MGISDLAVPTANSGDRVTSCVNPYTLGISSMSKRLANDTTNDPNQVQEVTLVLYDGAGVVFRTEGPKTLENLRQTTRQDIQKRDIGHEGWVVQDLVVKTADGRYWEITVEPVFRPVAVNELAEVLPEGSPDSDYVCDICERSWPREALLPLNAQEVLQRVEPGEPLPFGKCPVCDGLVNEA